MRHAALAVLAWLISAPCHAEGMGASDSSTLPAEGNMPGLGSLVVRSAAGALAASPARTIDGIRYDTDVDLKSAGAVIDWYPKGFGGFRLSGGLRVNGSAMDLAAAPSQAVTLGGGTYAPAQVGRLSGSVEFNRFAPYLGIGWQGSAMGGRMLIGLDFGALYQGRPDVQLTATGAAANPALADDLGREARLIEDNLSGLRFFPVVSLSFTYRF